MGGGGGLGGIDGGFGGRRIAAEGLTYDLGRGWMGGTVDEGLGWRLERMEGTVGNRDGMRACLIVCVCALC